MSMNIAIDGPAGAGKSTIAKLVAQNLGYIYVDTGAMYRALAVHFLRMGLGADDEKGISESLEKASVTISYEDGKQQVYLNHENVTPYLRTEETGNMASKSSAYPPVRAKLKDLQQTLARENDVVMDGRDIGTAILPNAQVKVFLTASVDERARRRYLELIEKGEKPDLEIIKHDIAERDYRDSHRKEAPLMQAEDAVLIDSSDMTIEEVTQAIMDLVQD